MAETLPTRPACWVLWDCCPDGSCTVCESGEIVPSSWRYDNIPDARQEARRLSADTPGSVALVVASDHIGQPVTNGTCIAEYMNGRDVHA